MSHKLPHTFLRSGSFVFNRRVPRTIQDDFGSAVVRVRLGRNVDRARELAGKLAQKLDEIWSSPVVRPVAVDHLVASVSPSVLTFEDAVDLCLANRGAGRGPEFEKVVRIAQRTFLEVAGNREISLYDRNDARAVLAFLQGTGVKTATVRRRFDTIKAIFQHAYVEQEVDKRNPFSRLSIPGEGLDASKRGTFTLAMLREIYREALTSGNEIRLIVPLLGDLGQSPGAQAQSNP